jgi:hypothetical protein
MIKSIASIILLSLLLTGLIVSPASAKSTTFDGKKGKSSLDKILDINLFPEAQELNLDPAQIISRHTHYPPKVIRKTVRFKPNSSPNSSQVRKIAASEQKIWGGPSLLNRINCESGFNYAATNGQYSGLLQIGSWWSYAWPQTPRKVVLSSSRTIKKPIIRHFKWSTGKLTSKTLKKRNVKLIIKRVGRLPANASPFHGYASIRVGQRAVSGRGPTTSWSCSL